MSPQDKSFPTSPLGRKPTSPLGRKPIQTGTPEARQSCSLGHLGSAEDRRTSPMALPSFFLRKHLPPREKQIREFSLHLPVLGLPEVCQARAVRDRLEAGPQAHL